ncbi:aldo/keto reductase [Mucisphaera sp.]|uniref:aldo/keto reductase n=1 Tax=Mucisphaera sp. TaxID=2913024 RepID=UPI003D0D881D
MDPALTRRPLGSTGLEVTPVGFGAFKIGRNQSIKYQHGYALPTEEASATLLSSVLDLGINHIDTAPAYGLSEERIGRALQHRRDEFILSTKVGENFEAGQSTYDFSYNAVTASVERSLQRLKTDRLDLVLIHSDGRDREILESSGAPKALDDLKQRGDVHAVGLSGKTIEGFERAMDWADVLMVEYHADDPSMSDVIQQAHDRGLGVLIKKGLASGRLDPASAIRFILQHPAVDSLTLGSLKIEHLRDNLQIAQDARVKRGRP